MKLKALANLSGKVGTVKKDAEFTVDAAHGRELIERGIAAEVASPAVESKPEAKRTKKA